jgi:tight adherence protein B
MIMSMPIILMMLFVGITAVSWFLIAGSVRSYTTYKTNFTESASSNLSQMFLFFDAKKLFAINVLAILFVPVIVYLLSDVIVYAVFAGIGILYLPKTLYRRMASRRINVFERDLPDAIAQIAGAMRAGATLPMAMEVMVEETKGPISQEFSLLLREHRMGVTLDEAFENLGERVKSKELDLVITASRIARDVGGNLAEIFERLSSTMREKASMEGKIKALTSQGKLQGWVVGLLPVGMVTILYQMEAEAMHPLFHSIFGWGTILIFCVLELLGMLFIKKIVSIDV